MTTRQHILQLVKKHAPASSSELVRKLRLSRKTVAMHLKKLVENGQIVKTGSTRSATYRTLQVKSPPPVQLIELHKNLKEASEHRVFSEADLKLHLKKQISTNSYGIVEYAFTEMLNNAIDHSRSKKAVMAVMIKNGRVTFRIRDFGIGLFSNIQASFKLADEYEAVDHVLKGKQTTQPDRHSGEGLFFTSRIADSFHVRSHKLTLTFDNESHDAFLKEQRFLRGTQVEFTIKKQSRKSLKELFDKYSNEKFEFKTGEVRVQIAADTGNVSRSQARRICFGLEKFDRIVFDFKGVKSIGQGFADEIFRVFAKEHPSIDLTFQNPIRPVEFMILRAIRGS